MQDKKNHKYSLGEEIASSVIHGVAAVLSVGGLVILVVLAATHGGARHVVSFSIFGSTLIILYTASTLYHSIPKPAVKKVCRVIDHCAIFLLIAGTYTPFLLVSLRGAWGWSIFGVVWAVAAAGIALETFFGSRFRKVRIILYILMGWLCVLAIREAVRHIPPPGLVLLAAGGLCYTAGVIFYVWRKLPYGHFVWHIFVLCGSICHYFAVLYCL